MKKLLITFLLLTSSLVFAEEAKSTTQFELFSTKNLAWGTMTLLGATALTAQEKKASSAHLALASLSMFSYGAFLNSYFTNSNSKKYAVAYYTKWIQIPAMFVLPVAGAIALKQFEKGKNKATGFGAIHKPSALVSLIGMGLTTLSLTFEF